MSNTQLFSRMNYGNKKENWKDSSSLWFYTYSTFPTNAIKIFKQYTLSQRKKGGDLESKTL